MTPFFKMAISDTKPKNTERWTTKRKQILWYSNSHLMDLLNGWFSVTEKAWKHFYCIKMCSLQKMCDFQMLVQQKQTRILFFKQYLIFLFVCFLVFPAQVWTFSTQPFWAVCLHTFGTFNLYLWAFWLHFCMSSLWQIYFCLCLHFFAHLLYLAEWHLLSKTQPSLFQCLFLLL